MKTIEERAKEASEGYADDGYAAGLYTGYKEGATEQRAIDIDKACEWLKNNCGHYDGATFSLHNVVFESQTEFLADFRKAMGE